MTMPAGRDEIYWGEKPQPQWDDYLRKYYFQGYKLSSNEHPFFSQVLVLSLLEMCSDNLMMASQVAKPPRDTSRTMRSMRTATLFRI